MDKDVAMALNELSRRITAMQQQMDEFFQALHLQNQENIELNAGAITELAELVGSEATNG